MTSDLGSVLLAALVLWCAVAFLHSRTRNRALPARARRGNRRGATPPVPLSGPHSWRELGMLQDRARWDSEIERRVKEGLR